MRLFDSETPAREPDKKASDGVQCQPGCFRPTDSFSRHVGCQASNSVHYAIPKTRFSRNVSLRTLPDKTLLDYTYLTNFAIR